MVPALSVLGIRHCTVPMIMIESPSCLEIIGKSIHRNFGISEVAVEVNAFRMEVNMRKFYFRYKLSGTTCFVDSSQDVSASCIGIMVAHLTFPAERLPTDFFHL